MGALRERWALWVEPTSPLPDRTREPRSTAGTRNPPNPRRPARALLERTLGPVLPTAANKTPPLRVGGNGELVFSPRAPRVHPCHGSLHYRIADPQATQDTNKERRVSLQGESCRFNLRAVREQGSDRISAALAYAACA